MKTFNTCKDLNPVLETGKLAINHKEKSVTFNVADLQVTFGPELIQEFVIDGMKKAVSAYSASFAKSNGVPGAIRETIEVWQDGKYADPAAKKRAAKSITTSTGKAYKLPHSRTLIEGALRDILGPDDGRTRKIESLSDELFSALIEAKGGEGYLAQAIERLNVAAKEKLEAEKASLLAEFGDLGL